MQHWMNEWIADKNLAYAAIYFSIKRDPNFD